MRASVANAYSKHRLAAGSGIIRQARCTIGTTVRVSVCVARVI